MTLENIISFIPLLFFSSEFINIIYKISNQLPFKENVKYFYGLILSTFSAQALKYLFPYPKSFYKYSMRPEGACDCDYLSSSGPVAENTPGLPSGHMSTTSYFVTYHILHILKNNYNKLLILPNIILLIGMGWARIKKLCHNLTQVISGTFLGALIAYIFFK